LNQEIVNIDFNPKHVVVLGSQIKNKLERKPDGLKTVDLMIVGSCDSLKQIK